MNIKNRIFALIGLDMILPTNFIYHTIFNRYPFPYYDEPYFDWVIEALISDFDWIPLGYWWMWIFIIIAYVIFTYKTEGGELSKNRGDTS